MTRFSGLLLIVLLPATLLAQSQPAERPSGDMDIHPSYPPKYPTDQSTRTGIDADRNIRYAEYLRILEEVRRRRQENFERYIENKKYLKRHHTNDLRTRRASVTSEALKKRAAEGLPPKLSHSEWNRATGKVDWPVALKLEIFDPPKQELEKLLAQFAQGEYVYFEAELEIQEIFTTLKEIVTTINPKLYTEANTFVKSMDYELLVGSTNFSDTAPHPQTFTNSPARRHEPVRKLEWISLFDGRTLAGWKADRYPEAWSVGADQSSIVGKGQPHGPSHLLCETGFADFEVETEVKINAEGSSGFYFRATQGDKFPQGYEIQIIGTSAGRSRHTTGDLYGKAKVGRNYVEDNTWFKLHVTAKGNHTIVALNDKTVLEYTDQGRSYRAGCFALQCWSPETVVYFRNLRARVLQ